MYDVHPQFPWDNPFRKVFRTETTLAFNHPDGTTSTIEVNKDLATLLNVRISGYISETHHADDGYDVYYGQPNCLNISLDTTALTAWLTANYPTLIPQIAEVKQHILQVYDTACEPEDELDPVYCYAPSECHRRYYILAKIPSEFTCDASGKFTEHYTYTE